MQNHMKCFKNLGKHFFSVYKTSDDFLFEMRGKFCAYSHTNIDHINFSSYRVYEKIYLTSREI